MIGLEEEEENKKEEEEATKKSKRKEQLYICQYRKEEVYCVLLYTWEIFPAIEIQDFTVLGFAKKYSISVIKYKWHNGCCIKGFYPNRV